jgi:hypothetical protein
LFSTRISVLKDKYGVAGSDLVEIKKAIAGLQKGELIIKNNEVINNFQLF